MLPPEIVTSRSEAETMAIGKALAQDLAAGDVVALKGDLGTGKTHFVKGMAPVFGIKKTAVHSPTFSLINEYGGTPPLYHFDCYRMESVKEALEIGVEEYLYGAGVCVIEWPERIDPLLPPHCIWVELETTGKTQRQFKIKKKGH